MPNTGFSFITNFFNSKFKDAGSDFVEEFNTNSNLPAEYKHLPAEGKYTYLTSLAGPFFEQNPKTALSEYIIVKAAEQLNAQKYRQLLESLSDLVDESDILVDESDIKGKSKANLLAIELQLIFYYYVSLEPNNTYQGDNLLCERFIEDAVKTLEQAELSTLVDRLYLYTTYLRNMRPEQLSILMKLISLVLGNIQSVAHIKRLISLPDNRYVKSVFNSESLEKAALRAVDAKNPLLAFEILFLSSNGSQDEYLDRRLAAIKISQKFDPRSPETKLFLRINAEFGRRFPLTFLNIVRLLCKTSGIRDHQLLQFLNNMYIDDKYDYEKNLIILELAQERSPQLAYSLLLSDRYNLDSLTGETLLKINQNNITESLRPDVFAEILLLCVANGKTVAQVLWERFVQVFIEMVDKITDSNLLEQILRQKKGNSNYIYRIAYNLPRHSSIAEELVLLFEVLANKGREFHNLSIELILLENRVHSYTLVTRYKDRVTTTVTKILNEATDDNQRYDLLNLRSQFDTFAVKLAEYFPASLIETVKNIRDPDWVQAILSDVTNLEYPQFALKVLATNHPSLAIEFIESQIERCPELYLRLLFVPKFLTQIQKSKEDRYCCVFDYLAEDLNPRMKLFSIIAQALTKIDKHSYTSSKLYQEMGNNKLIKDSKSEGEIFINFLINNISQYRELLKKSQDENHPMYVIVNFDKSSGSIKVSGNTGTSMRINALLAEHLPDTSESDKHDQKNAIELSSPITGFRPNG